MIITSLSLLLFAGLPLVSPDLLVNVRVNSPYLPLPLVRPAAGDGQEDVQHDAASHHSLVSASLDKIIMIIHGFLYSRALNKCK